MPIHARTHEVVRILVRAARHAAGELDRLHTHRLRERKLLGLTPTEPIALFKSVGCEQCDYQGYKGRQSILELLKIDAGIDELIARRATAREILTAARASGFKTLADDGIRLVRAGVTGIDELLRVVDLTDRMA